MSFQIKIEGAAARQIKKLPADVRARLIERIAALAEEPRPPGAKSLQSRAKYWRLRSGNYRIVYMVDDGQQRIRIVLVGDRRDIYKRLRRTDE